MTREFYIYISIYQQCVDIFVTQDIEREAELAIDRLMLHAPVRKTKQKRGIYEYPGHMLIYRYTLYTIHCVANNDTMCVMCLLVVIVHICTIVLCVHMYLHTTIIMCICDVHAHDDRDNKIMYYC